MKMICIGLRFQKNSQTKLMRKRTESLFTIHHFHRTLRAPFVILSADHFRNGKNRNDVCAPQTFQVFETWKVLPDVIVSSSKDTIFCPEKKSGFRSSISFMLSLNFLFSIFLLLS